MWAAFRALGLRDWDRFGNVNTPTAAADTVGMFRASSRTFMLRNSLSSGPADLSVIFGASGDLPVAGDWDGDGVDTIGVYRPSTGQFFLRNSNAPDAPIAHSFFFGTASDTPIIGDWNGDGCDSVGVFRPSNGLIYLRNGLQTGFADFTMVLGVPGDQGLAGDWDGNGKDSPGVYRPGNRQFYLVDDLCNCTVFADYQGSISNQTASGLLAMVGDWNGDGKESLGLFNPANGQIDLRNAITGSASSSTTFFFGGSGDRPLVGRFGRAPALTPPASLLGAPSFVPGN
jgi:endoglucanase